MTTAPSHPNDSLWYRQQSADPIGSGAPPCVTCAQWTGDYVGFEYARDGSRNMVWTDMRRPLGLSGSGLEGLIGPPPDGFTEDAFFARKP
ncbi:MAG TPA: hypothetical protein VE401_03625 [Solirubrobacterales bacterium]|nr:hypothetical protein [Solirubrobacterales bacterium]HZA89299.1 hypothetical protein [Solirubrobacterales bacterium]